MKRKLLRWLKKYGFMAIVCIVGLEFLLYIYCEFLFYSCIGALIFVVLLGCIDFGLSKTIWLNRLREPVIYPNNDWYREHFERGFDSIILGNSPLKDSVIKRCNDYIGDKCFDFTLKKQPLVWDFIVLQNFFSILKDGGCAIFQLTEENIKSFPEYPKHMSRYYKGMSTYLFSKSELGYWFIKMTQFSSLLFLACYICENLKPKNKANYNSIAEFKNEIIEFCKIRNILPVFVIHGGGKFNPFFTQSSQDYKLIVI